MIRFFSLISFQAKLFFIGFSKDTVEFNIDEFAVDSKSIVLEGPPCRIDVVQIDVVVLSITVLSDSDFFPMFLV